MRPIPPSRPAPTACLSRSNQKHRKKPPEAAFSVDLQVFSLHKTIKVLNSQTSPFVKGDSLESWTYEAKSCRTLSAPSEEGAVAAATGGEKSRFDRQVVLTVLQSFSEAFSSPSPLRGAPSSYGSSIKRSRIVLCTAAQAPQHASCKACMDPVWYVRIPRTPCGHQMRSHLVNQNVFKRFDWILVSEGAGRRNSNRAMKQAQIEGLTCPSLRSTWNYAVFSYPGPRLQTITFVKRGVVGI